MAAIEQDAFIHEFTTGRPVDRPIHPAAAHQRGVRRIHDRVHPERGDVSTDRAKNAHRGKIQTTKHKMKKNGGRHPSTALPSCCASLCSNMCFGPSLRL